MGADISAIEKYEFVKGQRLRCTATLLEQPFVDCIVNPFLGAFYKKRGAGVRAGDWAPSPA